MSTSESVPNVLYESAAQYGRFRSKISVFFGTIVALISFLVGVYFIFIKANVKQLQTTATIDNGTCSIVSIKSKIPSYNCTLSLNYTVDNKVYNNTLTTTSLTPYQKGQTINIMYDESNPNIINSKNLSSTAIGVSLSCFSLFILSIVWGYYLLLSKNKSLAAIYGTESLFNFGR